MTDFEVRDMQTRTLWAWLICEFTNIWFLLAFLITFVVGVLKPRNKIQNIDDHNCLQSLRLCLVVALICQCIYPLQWVVEFSPTITTAFFMIAASYDIILPTILTAIVIRMFRGYRALFYPQFGNASVDESSSSLPMYYLSPTFIWCISTWGLAVIQFFHYNFKHNHLYQTIFFIYSLVWACLEALFLIQLMYILVTLQILLRKQYKYKKTLEVGIVKNGIPHIETDNVDTYKLVMESMIRRMRRLIIGFSTYFLFIEGSYIWLFVDHFRGYNKFEWIIVHTLLGHMAIHATLLYYVRIREENEHKNNFSFDQENEQKSFESQRNAELFINENAGKLTFSSNITDKRSGDTVVHSSQFDNPYHAINHLPSNLDITGQGTVVHAEEWEQYEHSYQIKPVDN